MFLILNIKRFFNDIIFIILIIIISYLVRFYFSNSTKLKKAKSAATWAQAILRYVENSNEE
jgi:hypothetical protein